MNKNKKLSALKDLISKRRSRPQVAQPKTVNTAVKQPKVEATKVEAPKVEEKPVEQPQVEVAETPTAPIAEEAQVEAQVETPVEVPQEEAPIAEAPAETVEAEVKPKRRNRRNREVENG